MKIFLFTKTNYVVRWRKKQDIFKADIKENAKTWHKKTLFSRANFSFFMLYLLERINLEKFFFMSVNSENKPEINAI